MVEHASFRAGDSVELHRGACEGTCPVYTVRLRGDGTASYYGALYVPRIGRFKGAFPPRDFEHVVRLLETVNFFAWAGSYSEPVTCMPPYAIAVSLDGREKTVEQYATDEPPAFWAVARIIDAIANEITWVTDGADLSHVVTSPAAVSDRNLSAAAPAPIQEVVRSWRSAGSVAQPPMEWPRERWFRQFPNHAQALRSLPDGIDRSILRQACKDAARSAESAERAFIAVMAWGYGAQVGYGPWRTERVLKQTPGAAARLATVAETLLREDAVTAYGRLGRGADCRLRGLGPAFGTKYLYFCQPAGSQPTALILDKLVADWLAREGLLHLDPVPWSVRTYRRYLQHMHDWASAVRCTADELEYCIFRVMVAERGGQWG